MRFDPSAVRLTCDHCGNQEDMALARAESIKELDIQEGLRGAVAGAGDAVIEQTRVLTCHNCSAQIEFDPDVHAKECPYCATPFVTDTGLHRHIKPAGLIPFALDERAARKAVNNWLGRLWFAPNDLQKYARNGRRLGGIYVPYWTFDAQTHTAYSGQRGNIYYTTATVIVNGKRQTKRVPKVRWRSVSGRVQRFFDDVLVLASKSLPKRYTDALAPWDLSSLVPYSPAYLAGFRAEGYQIELESGLKL
ncbi:MAG: primosomal protein N' (replication factor Y) - superfamily II helicase, partial [Pseudomonadota bacterium]